MSSSSSSRDGRRWSFSSLNSDTSHSQVVGLRHRRVDLRRKVQSMLDSRVCSGVPRSFSFFFDDDGDCASTTRLFFLGQHASHFAETSLYYVDVPRGAVDGSECSFDSSEPFTSVPIVQWASVFPSTFDCSSGGALSEEEILLRERTRTVSSGITSYSLDGSSGLFLVPCAGGTLLSFHASRLPRNSDSGGARRVVSPHPGVRMDAERSPVASDLIAFVRNGDIWVSSEPLGVERRLTHARPTPSSPPHISCGVADYIAQEEFDRYTGYWWQPPGIAGSSGEEDDEPLLRIFYHRVDESAVSQYFIPKAGSIDGSVDEYRYPLAGGVNPSVSMRLLEFSPLSVTKDVDDGDASVHDMALFPPLKERFEWVEYVPRCGWVPHHNDDGAPRRVWMFLLDRSQQKCALITVPITEFKRLDEVDQIPPSSVPKHTVLFQEESDVWINVTDLTTFLDDGRVIVSSERSGYRHLYIVEDGEVRPITRPLSRGGVGGGDVDDDGWVVLDRPLHVDQRRELVYFVANRETPLEEHLYVASYSKHCDAGNNIKLLTKAGFSHSATVSPCGDLFVSCFSNLSTPWQAAIFRILHRPGRAPGELPSSTSTAAYIRLPLSFHEPCFDARPPELFTYTSISGKTGHGAFFAPPMASDHSDDGPFPALLYVYGGPHVQLVTRSFQMTQRWKRLQLLASEGIVAVMADGVGSWNRGLAWEGTLKYNMGSPEIQDQVLALRQLIARGIVDPNRIAVTGTSYGGYLSLRFLGLRPDVFKLSVSVAPVTQWEAYDTGYTERYMGVPQDHADAYERGSVLEIVKDFPDEEDRLVIVHGEIDENVHYAHTSTLVQKLVDEGKPYRLQLYPSERHGLRSTKSLRHYEFTFVSYLKRHL